MANEHKLSYEGLTPGEAGEKAAWFDAIPAKRKNLMTTEMIEFLYKIHRKLMDEN